MTDKRERRARRVFTTQKRKKNEKVPAFESEADLVEGFAPIIIIIICIVIIGGITPPPPPPLISR